MNKYLAILKKNYKKGVSTVSELFFMADGVDEAKNHVDNLISEAKAVFGVEMICVFLEEVR